TATSTDVNGRTVTYTLTGDTSGGGFAVNSTTGDRKITDPNNSHSESSGTGHIYNMTVQASDGTLSSSQTFTIGVTDVAPSQPTDDNAAAHPVPHSSPTRRSSDLTATSTDVNGGTVTYTLTGDTSGGGFAVNSTT